MKWRNLALKSAELCPDTTSKSKRSVTLSFKELKSVFIISIPFLLHLGKPGFYPLIIEAQMHRGKDIGELHPDGNLGHGRFPEPWEEGFIGHG